jgi:trehalose/maltose transport system permease protein
METSGAIPQETSPPQNTFAAKFYSGLYILMGLGALAVLIFIVINNPVIQTVVSWSPTEESTERPSLILAFLSELGIVIPSLLLITGVTFIRLGVRLYNGHVLMARWAETVLLWLAGGGVLMALINMVGIARALADERITAGFAAFLPVTLPLLAVPPLLYGWYWLMKNSDAAFHGQELLRSRQTRFAWNLLIPSLVIFVFVAARPLEQTFIRSLTDKRFASAEIPSFVGLENYTNLLNMRLDRVACRIDDDTNECSVRDSGILRWEQIDRDHLQEGFRTAWNIPIPGKTTEGLRYSVAVSGLDSDFLESLWTTLVFSVASVSLELVIGLFMALVVNSDFAGRGFMRAVMLIPWAIPTVISARLWELILKDTSAGLVNLIMLDLRLIDAPRAWLSDPTMQLPAAIMVDVWKTSPFMALLLLAGLQTIPKDLYEAASVDGANQLRRFFAITLPLLRPTIAVALVFRMLDALRMFDLFNVLFGRQQLSMATYNYELLVNNQQDGYASAVSMIIFLIIGVFAVVYVRILNVETD